jgi:RNA-directed DNA polymerase
MSTSVLELSAEEAKVFFLQESSYCSFDIPTYFSFEGVFSRIAGRINDGTYSSYIEPWPDKFENVNYKLLNNKNGQYAWRPHELIHPFLYMSLVDAITNDEAWEKIKNRFSTFSSDPSVSCLSLPVQSETSKSDKGEQILQWWRDVEQKSIELSLQYQFLHHTDITNCYGSIYTHSIPWAIHTKEVAKKPGNRNEYTMVGNNIDRQLRWMSNGQTNGIPQGSVIMDFIAEIVLGYGDLLLSRAIGDDPMLDNIDFQILRYRDDYRIFTNSTSHTAAILKTLTEVLETLNFRLNERKTNLSSNAITGSIKGDKVYWMQKNLSYLNVQKRLLAIHELGQKFPNSGSLLVAMTDFHKSGLIQKTNPYSPKSLVSIVINIAFHNPRVYPVAMAIVSQALDKLETEDEKIDIVDLIRNRFDLLQHRPLGTLASEGSPLH